jgi:tripartite-type tricarboxylate transporter receptor subunit TctC
MSNAYAAAAAVAVSLVCAAQPAAAQSYPSKPIRIIVATAAGGGTDFNGRLVAQKLTEQTGQQAVVENRAGASTIIGTEAVARAAPDGYTLLAAQSTITINPSMFAKLPYDMIRDFAPVSHTLTAPNLLTVHPSVPARTVKEFVALAKARPGSLTYGSAGPGTSPHLSGELLKALAKIDVLHVAYKGSGPSLISLIAGETDVGFPSVPASIQHIKSGRLRGLAVTTKARAKALPEVPSIAEGGVAGYEATQWFGILAPAGTPRPVIDRLYHEIAQGLRSPDLRERLVAEGMEVVASTPDQFASYIRSETDKWSRVIKSAGIKPQ